ncbi:MAG: tRNA uridine-5-carboxymethylaminomethyl(34) synthesis GTPase MnmE [Anaerolineae bacterium]|nr:tRNA uridine-5-carboxymethylaminomethyl(34) synthesis GTPase MnmE [Anaerolineae bacterium]NIN93971.1 tRNA uridine-5-carboxymethylaminomethyl(34) synthesis GTPase MnmE [Anaerolineae bacterium]NIQ77004.1 tRNA uridine-5-carboxymethylaminomethyl(34) synthesis GTPase MnmE [Anaerolineae bacterium]
MYSLDDTITAISSPVGEGGIGIVKMSGPEVLSILREIFVPSKSRLEEDTAWEPLSHHLYHGHIVDPRSQEVVDEVLVSYMKAPHTYTRQDVGEINCHGGIVPLQRVLQLTLRQGARLASPGEMTMRAFLLGRLDLAQAEAVLDVVRAKTEAGLRVAVEQLGGHLSQEIRGVRAQLVDTLAYLEATIDFTEDEIPDRDITVPLQEAARAIEELLDGADRGMIYRQGIRAAIVGRPNVGKSSLLNRLLRTARAIVTPIPGTTRDTLEETINLQGIPVTLVDTAGIAKSEDLVEKLGVERSREALKRADLALMTVDVSEPLQEADIQIADLIGDKPAILVANKIDLPQLAVLDSLLPGVNRVRVSALTGEGLEELEEAMVEAVFSGKVMASDVPLITNPRHKQALHEALEHVEAALEASRSDTPTDLIAIDVTAAVNALGEITGETATEDLLQIIFSEFCVGK